MATMNIDALLKKYKLNQRELAESTGINENTISRYCNGTFKKIDKNHIDLICKYFKCTPNDIFKIDDTVEVTPAKILYYDTETDDFSMGRIKMSTIEKNKSLLNNNYPIQSGINYSNLKENPRNALIEQEVQRFYSKLLTLLLNYDFMYNVDEYIKRNLSVISINFNSLPLHSFIFSHSTFLSEALSYTTFGNEFTPMITYLNNVYYQGGIAILQEQDKQNLINSFEYFYDKYFSNNNSPQKDLLRRIDIYNEYNDKPKKD